MNELHTVRPLSLKARIGYGILLPLGAFLGFQYELIESAIRDNMFMADLLVVSSVLLTPALPVMNGWVLPIRWQSRLSVFFSGLILPSIIGVIEYLFAYPPQSMKTTHGELNLGTEFPLKLFIAMLFAPLVASLIYAVMRKWNKR